MSGIESKIRVPLFLSADSFVSVVSSILFCLANILASIAMEGSMKIIRTGATLILITVRRQAASS